MTEKEKIELGLLYDANYDGEIVRERQRVNELCFEYNLLKPSQINERQDLMKKIL